MGLIKRDEFERERFADFMAEFYALATDWGYAIDRDVVYGTAGLITATVRLIQREEPEAHRTLRQTQAHIRQDLRGSVEVSDFIKNRLDQQLEADNG